MTPEVEALILEHARCIADLADVPNPDYAFNLFFQPNKLIHYIPSCDRRKKIELSRPIQLQGKPVPV